LELSTLVRRLTSLLSDADTRLGVGGGRDNTLSIELVLADGDSIVNAGGGMREESGGVCKDEAEAERREA